MAEIRFFLTFLTPIVSDQNGEQVEIPQTTAASTLASSILSLCGGLTLGFSAMMLSQLIEDKEFTYDEKYNSWIASISPLSMPIGCLCCGSFIDAYGRRTGHIVLAFPFIAGWLTLAFAQNVPTILVGRFLTGLCTGAMRPLTMIYLGEITDPQYRAMALFCPSLAMNTGVLFSHVIFTYMYWKWGSLVCGIPNLISLVMFCFLQESPVWLISKGKTEIGIKSFSELRGNNKSAIDELESLLAKHKQKTRKLQVKEIIGILFSSKFFKPYATTFFLFLSVQFCGINVMPFYAKDIIGKTFSTEIDTFLLIMILDCIMVLSLVLICLIGQRLPRKKTFLTCSFGTALVLFIFSTLLYFDLVYVSVALMVIYIGLSIVTVSISWSIVGEIFPTSIRGLGSGISSATSHFLLFIAVKVTPSIMNTFDEKVLFVCYGTVALICSIIICFILPETNGKSLNDIEESYCEKKIDNVTSL